ncbi:hypothetical protein HMPREF1317_2397, partial [Schaalia georgiae F0490]
DDITVARRLHDGGLRAVEGGQAGPSPGARAQPDIDFAHD